MGNIGGLVAQGGGGTGGGSNTGNLIGGILSLLSTGLGAFSQVRAGRETAKQRERLSTLSSAPLRTAEIFQPMTEAERKALERQIHAELEVRGIPRDSAYATALASELIAKTETDRYQAALQAAIGQRGTAINAITGMPAYPTGGNTGALGNWLQLQSILKAMTGKSGGAQPRGAAGSRLRDPGAVLFNPETFSESLYGPDQWEEALGGPLTLGG